VILLYAHETLNFASLGSVMIATLGDEAFVMFSKIPETAIKLNIIVLASSQIFFTFEKMKI